MARYRRRADARFAASAVAAGVALAALAAHSRAGAAGERAGSAAQMSAVSSNVALGERMAAAAGWTGPQWSCLNALWTRESGWRATVWNAAGSGAYGIPQSLPASKMAAAGSDYMTDPATQIRWGLSDIRSVYGTPCGAWDHETRAGWY